MKTSEDRCQEDQEEEDKKGKQVYWLHILALHSENCKSKIGNWNALSKQVYLKSQLFIVLNLSELLQMREV